MAENTSHSPDFTAEHGLSLYIETENNKILFDLGQSGVFAENAKAAGVDLAAVDTVIISHGHYDHGGGLSKFIKLNNKAKIYIKEDAFGDYFNSDRYIGLNKELKSCKNIVFTTDNFKINDSLTLFSGIIEREYFSSANDFLFMKCGEEKVKDTFSHEQYLVINANEKQVLITGCAHKGIVNILRKFENQYKNCPECLIIGGFHLYLKSLNRCEKEENIKAIANILKETNNMFYTCHCTGEKPYNIMKSILCEKLQYFSTGESIVF